MASDNSLLPMTKLLSVSHVFYEKTMAALVQENANLKLQLFWKDHNLEKLRNAMQFGNEETGPHCKCLVCSVSGRKSEPDTNYHSKCTFKSWFENHLTALEIQTSLTVSQNHNEFECRAHPCIDGYGKNPIGPFFDDDVHLCHFSGTDDWFLFSYGAKLWKSKSVNDPELQKLKSLFAILYRESSNTDEDRD